LFACKPFDEPIVQGAAIGGTASGLTGGSVVKGAIVGGAVGALIDESQ